MSHSTQTIGVLRTLNFDVAKTNFGNGYHPAKGVFIAPESGVYVFTWSIRQGGSNYHSTNFMVNADVLGSLYTNADGASSTGTGVVVTYVDAGDDVFIRTNGFAPDNVGVIDTNGAGRSSFAGWKLF
jgi:hypothetical protein